MKEGRLLVTRQALFLVPRADFSGTKAVISIADSERFVAGFDGGKAGSSHRPVVVVRREAGEIVTEGGGN